MSNLAFMLNDRSDLLEIDVKSPVGKTNWWVDTVSANDVRRAVKESKASTIRLWINSDGGDVFEGLSIYQQLVSSPARVEVTVSGLAASAASLIAMAGDSIEMGAGSWMMIHETWGRHEGRSSDLRAWADVLDRITDDVAGIYAKRTGQSVATVRDMLAKETWLTAEQALSLGFATAVAPAKATAKNSARMGEVFLSSHYENTPAELLARLGQKPGSSQLELLPKESDMSIPKSIRSALNLKDDADEPSVLKAIAELQSGVSQGLASINLASKFEAATGKSGEEALGTALAWKASHERLAATEAELAKTKADAEAKAFEAFLSGARDGSAFEDKKPRLTKAESDKLAEQVTSGAMSREAAEAFVRIKSPVSHLQAAPAAAGGASGGSVKSYRNMSNRERAQLQRDNPESYAQLRDAWERDGAPGPEQAA